MTKFSKSLVLASMVLLFAELPGAASRNYQERDGIYGEIKFAEFCNMHNGLRYRVIAEAGSRDSRVSRVEFKIYTRYSIGVNIAGQQFGLPSGENWRNLRGEMYNNKWGDKRFYDTGVLFSPLISIIDSPVKFSIHVNHTRGKTIDLGGIVDMGKIEQGKCRVYDDGNFR
ncbi:hypothetical protein [Microcoleus sp. FACHB-831]|uniref:hypothetical protein n=1 Tax=Microcoleus sp. FACHB-831 TaxID=2692827 RepID=UPI00168265D0|nr:hypothetical protein [Microcoleus sp. FACHB-831]